MNPREDIVRKNFVVQFHVDKIQDDNEEGYVNEDLGPPEKASSMKEEGKNTDGNKEDGCVNDDMGSPPDRKVQVQGTNDTGKGQFSSLYFS